MNLRWIIPLPCAALGFAVGFLQSDRPFGVANSLSIPVALGSTSEPSSAATGLTSDEHNPREQLEKELRSAGFLPSRVQRVAEISELFASLSLPELLIASDLLQELPSNCRDDAKIALALRLLEIDPHEAARFVDKQSGELSRLPEILVGEWQRHDPASAIIWLTQHQGVDVGQGADFKTSWRLREWANTDPKSAAELVISSPGKFGPESVSAVFESWAKQSPGDAMARASDFANGRLRRSAMDAALRTWVKNDPQSALEWFEQIEDETSRDQLTVALAVGLAATDRSRSIELMQSLPGGRNRDVAITKLAESFRDTSFDESLSLVQDVAFEPGNEALKIYYWGLFHERPEAALSSLLQRVANASDVDEREAVEKFVKESSPGMLGGMPGTSASIEKSVAAIGAAPPSSTRLELLERATSEWARADVNAARNWCEALPPGDTREHALAGVLQSWTWSAPNEAAAWIDQQPPSPDRDAAVGGFVIAALSRDPTGSVARLRTMRDPAGQLAALQVGWRYWLRSDRSAAQTWHDTSPDLTSAERASLKADAR